MQTFALATLKRFTRRLKYEPQRLLSVDLEKDLQTCCLIKLPSSIKSVKE